MTVDPAMPVSRLFLKCSPKLRSFIKLKETGNLRFLLEVDGSCNRNTTALLGASA